MATLFRKAQSKFVGGKFFVFGETGSGKSKFVLSFPKVAVVDTESGVSDYEDDPNLVFVANTTSHKDIYDAIVEIEEEFLGEIETFAVDSETKVYDSMQITSMEVEERKAKSKGGDVDDQLVSQRGWGKIKTLTKKLQSAKIDLSSKGIFIVSTAQASDLSKQVGNERVVIGQKSETHKSLPFDYDVVLRFYTEEKVEKGKKTAVYKAEVLKDRTETFKKFDIIENPSFEMWKPYYDNKKAKGVGIETHYKADTSKDITAIVEEENLIEKSKAKLSEIQSLGEEHKVEIVRIYKTVGIKNHKEIVTDTIAQQVIKMADEYIASVKGEESEE